MNEKTDLTEKIVTGHQVSKLSNDASLGEPLCEKCGEPYRVRILKGYKSGKPMIGHYCFGCSDRIVEERSGLTDMTGLKHPLDLSTLTIFFGVLISFVGLFSDYMGLWEIERFSILQRIIIGSGAVFVVMGGLFRIDMMIVVGGVLLGVSGLADTVGISGIGGIGWKQQTAILFGMAVIVIGIWQRWRKTYTARG
jgi:hypothetical protein